MKWILVLTCLLVGGLTVNAQDDKVFPAYPVPAEYRMKSANGTLSLPDRWNNAYFEYFPDVFAQEGWSCNQASSIGYVLTYELNRLRGTKADDPSRLFNPGFVYSFLNEGSYGIGVSYFDSWEIVKAAGSPNYIDYPYYGQSGIWMSGYDRYLKAMNNRVTDNWSMPLGTPEDLLIFKQFLYNRFEEGAESGGVGSFQIASGGMDESARWLDPVTNVNWPVMRHFGDDVGHAMTFIGYNDSVRIDINNDGLFRNDFDNNNDSIIDMRDWEVGALLAVNSWGKGYGLGGFIYVPYRLVAYDGHQGGIWNKSAHIIAPVKEYVPTLTLRVVMSHQSKNRFRVLAGISTDPSAKEPEQLMSFPHFNYQGGYIPLRNPSPLNPADSMKFEFALDISPLMVHLTPQQKAKFFLIIEENDPMNAAEGRVWEFSVNLHKADGSYDEVLSSNRNVEVVNDGWTVLSVERSIDFNKLDVDHPETLNTRPGDPFSLQLAASGGQPPYTWSLVHDYHERNFMKIYNPVRQDTLLKRGVNKQFSRVDLPFLFPYWGKEYDHIYVDRNGAIHFDTEYYQYPYVVDWNLVFKVRKSIVPLGMLLSMTAPEDMVCSAITDSTAVISWDVSHRTSLNIDYDIKFSVTLSADGKIEFHYGRQQRPPGQELNWTAGLSNGDGRFFKMARVKDLGVIFENYVTLFEPFPYPEELTLNSDGLLRGTALESDRIWNILVQVRDKNQQSATAAIPVTTVDWEHTEILLQNYPNPFKRTTLISFRNPGYNRVTLDVIDLSGRQVRRLVDEVLMAGDYTVTWNARDEANLDVQPGVYLYRMISGKTKATGKMLLLTP